MSDFKPRMTKNHPSLLKEDKWLDEKVDIMSTLLTLGQAYPFAYLRSCVKPKKKNQFF